jgi:hypothetical protein
LRKQVRKAAKQEEEVTKALESALESALAVEGGSSLAADKVLYDNL